MLDKIKIILTDHPKLARLDQKLCDIQMDVCDRYKLLCIISNQNEMDELLNM